MRVSRSDFVLPGLDPADALVRGIELGAHQTAHPTRFREKINHPTQNANQAPMKFLCREVGAGFSRHGDKSAGFDRRTDLRFIWTRNMNIMGSNGWTLGDQETLVEMVRGGMLKPVDVRQIKRGADG